MSYSYSLISDVLEGKFISNIGDCTIKHLITDSRSNISPDDSAFFAIKGERHNGHQYISELYLKKGLKNFVVEYIDDAWKNYNARFIVVSNVLVALQKIAAHHRSTFHKPVIGITGSNGKTIVKEWLFQLLQPDMHIIRSPKSYNSQVGVPLSVWNIENNADIAIFEAGISQKGEMQKLEEIIKPTIGIFTNIGEAHQENFLSLEEKVSEKVKLFLNCETIIYCSDYQLIEKIIQLGLKHNQKLISWSTKKDADLRITNINKSDVSTCLIASYESNEIKVQIPFTDEASIENAIHCWALMLTMGYSPNIIEQRMKSLSPVAMRLELKKGVRQCTIINDAYNSDIHSLEIALDFLNQQQQHSVKTIILSDILESGKNELSLYEEVASLIKKKKINKLVGIGQAISRNANLFTCEKYFFQNTQECIQYISSLNLNNEAILLKGARNFEFEKISALLELKTHRTVLEINLNNMVHNLNYFRSKLKPDTKIMVMVKAFSYGSGSYEIANMLAFQKINYLAVAFADEGVALREAGITTPIAVMNPEEASFKLMIDNNLQPEIYSYRVLKMFTDTLQSMQISKYPIHIKLDTGMHRLGFGYTEIDELCKILNENQSVFVQSIFSHLAASDEAIHDEFTMQQISLFEQMSEKIQQKMGYPVLKHILNSSGIERFTDSQFDMVRLGIGLYGISAENQENLRNVSSLKTTILQTKTVPKHDTIGYGRKGKAVNDTRIAVLPIGYADGYARILGNGNGRVFVNGHFAPIIGNICMDMCMVNITGIEANEGDEVELFGDNISIIELANKMNTIPYEVLTSISNRVKRIYFQE